MGIWSKKSLAQLTREEGSPGGLKRTLSGLNLMLLGVGAIIGAGHLRGDGHGGSAARGARHRPVLRARGPGLPAGGAVLRRVRGDDPRGGQCLYLWLCHPGRARRVDDRLGLDARVPLRLVSGGGGLVRLLHGLRARLPALEHPRATGERPLRRGEGWACAACHRGVHQPAGGAPGGGHHGVAGGGHPRVSAPQQRHRLREDHRRAAGHRLWGDARGHGPLEALHPGEHGPLRAVRLERGAVGGGRHLLRLYRLRRRLHRRAGDEEPAEGLARGHPGLAGGVHGVVRAHGAGDDGPGALLLARRGRARLRGHLAREGPRSRGSSPWWAWGPLLASRRWCW